MDNIAATAKNILAVVDAGVNLVASLPSWLNPIENVSKELKALAIVAATVADTVDLISGLMPWNWGSGKASTALGWNLSSGQMSHLQELKYSDPKYVSYNAAGTDSWRGGLTWVGESGPELVSLPRGTQIYPNQESRQIAAASGTDTRRLEQQQAETNALLREVRAELAGWRVKERMARA